MSLRYVKNQSKSRRYDSIDGNAAIRDSFALIPGNDFKELLT